VKLNGDARGYAAALATLEENRWPAGEPALAATGGSLMKRIHRLIEQQERPRTGATPVFALGLLVVSLGVAVGGWQTKPAPRLPDGRGFDATLAGPAPVMVPKSRQTPKPRATLLAQALPEPQQVSPVQAEKDQQLHDELNTPYRKWLTEDVAYIITNEERAAFKLLETKDESEHFIEQFWLRRDPTPGTPENEFKEEHYRRIAYANEHYASKIPGWKTDRGRIYITYGPPDEIDSHPSGGAYQRPAAEGGGKTSTFPFEQWRYPYIQGIGTDIVIEFVDPTMTGEYRMTMDPSEKDALRFVVPPAAAVKANATAQSIGNGGALLSVPLIGYGNHAVNVMFRITTAARRPVTNFSDTVRGPAPAYTRFLALTPGVYRLEVTLRDTTTGERAVDDVSFEVK
jgi:GWxTD domain-containing protein